MYQINIPKEYVLERPACYDEYKFKMHLAAMLTITNFISLYESSSKLFNSFFETEEHAQIAYDLLRYIMDTEEIYNQEIIKKRLIISMCESGFFG